MSRAQPLQFGQRAAIKHAKPMHPGAAAQTAERPSGEGLETDVYQQVGIGYESGQDL